MVQRSSSVGLGVSLVSPQPDLFWSDTSDQGWGLNLLNQFLGSLVVRGTELLHQPARAPGHLSRPSPLRSFSDGLHDRGVYQQHHISVVHPQTGRDILSYLELQSPTPPSLGRDHGVHVGAPVRHEGPKRGCGFPERSGPGHRLRMDLGSGRGRRAGEALAGGNQSFCHLSQLSASRVFLALERSNGGGDRFIPSILGRAPG